VRRELLIQISAKWRNAEAHYLRKLIYDEQISKYEHESKKTNKVGENS